MHLSSFQKYNVNNSVVVRFCPDVGVYVSESGLQNYASPMIWKYIPNMDVKEISKALFCSHMKTLTLCIRLNIVPIVNDSSV